MNYTSKSQKIPKKSMPPKKYYFINIQIPLEVLPSKENHLLSDRIDITFSECPQLPPIKENHATLIPDKIREFIEKLSREPSNSVPEPTTEPTSGKEPTQNSEPPPPPRVAYVTKTHQKHPKNPNANISFKNRQKVKSREFTVKNYDTDFVT